MLPAGQAVDGERACARKVCAVSDPTADRALGRQRERLQS